MEPDNDYYFIDKRDSKAKRAVKQFNTWCLGWLEVLWPWLLIGAFATGFYLAITCPNHTH